MAVRRSEVINRAPAVRPDGTSPRSGWIRARRSSCTCTSSGASAARHPRPTTPASTLAYCGQHVAPVRRMVARRAAVVGSLAAVKCTPSSRIPATSAAWQRRTAELQWVWRCGVRPARRTSSIHRRMGDGPASGAYSIAGSGSARRRCPTASRERSSGTEDADPAAEGRSARTIGAPAPRTPRTPAGRPRSSHRAHPRRRGPSRRPRPRGTPGTCPPPIPDVGEIDGHG